MTTTKTAPYCWVITKDHLAEQYPDQKTCVGVSGPRGVHLTREQIEAHPDGKKFRLLDDDREVYVEGVFLDLTPGKKLDGFEPQDDYGEGGLGTTSIQYFEAGKGGGWKDL